MERCQYFWKLAYRVDHRVKILIKVEALAIICSLWLCSNDKLSNDKNSSLM
jgi:hypothetical protein